MALVSGSGATGAIRAGLAYVELSADDKKLTGALDRARVRLQQFGLDVANIGLRLASAGASLFDPLSHLFGDAVEYAANMKILATEVGDTTENVSGLAYALKTAGVEQEEFLRNVKSLGKELSAAADGSKEADEHFRRLGLEARALIRLPLKQQLITIASAIERIPLASDRAAVASEFFGRNGTRVLRIFANGAVELEKRLKNANRVGAVITEEQGEQALRLKQAWAQALASIHFTFQEIGRSLFSTVDSEEEFANKLIDILAVVRLVIKENKALVLTLLLGSAAFTAAGIAVATVGGVIAGAMTIVKAVILSVAAAYGLLAGAVGIAYGVMATPVGAGVLGGLAGVATALVIISQTESGQENIRDLGKAFTEASNSAVNFLDLLKVIGTQAFEGIRIALQNGDIPAAAKIAWQGLKVVFYDGIARILQQWEGFRNTFLDGWDKVVLGAKLLWNDFVAYIAISFGEALSRVFTRTRKLAESLGFDTLAERLGDVAGRAEDLIVKADVSRSALRKKLIAETIDSIAERSKELGKSLDPWKTALDEAYSELRRLTEAEAVRATVANVIATTQDAARRAAEMNRAMIPALADAAKGIFGGALASRSLGIGDKVGQRQLAVSEQQLAELKELNKKVGEGGGPVFGP